jgi:hypothetical protein
LPASSPAPLPPPQAAWTSATAEQAEGVQQVAAQPPIPPDAGARAREEAQEYRYQLEPPGPEKLFRLMSESRLQEQIRQENRRPSGVERVVFPEEPPVSTDRYLGRRWPAAQEVAEPYYVCYGRLHFEEKNTERYGWELGVLQPFVSTLNFYKDVLLLPYHIGTEPCRHFECNAGYCLPGDPVPYLLYPPNINLTGLVAEGAAATGVFLAFP